MMKKSPLQSPLFDCQACQDYRRFLEPSDDNQGKCLPLEGRQCFLEKPFDIKKVPQVNDYIELIW